MSKDTTFNRYFLHYSGTNTLDNSALKGYNISKNTMGCGIMSIKSIRKETGLTQQQFAEKYHISVRTLQHWEQGRKTPPYVIFLLERLNQYEKTKHKTFRIKRRRK